MKILNKAQDLVFIRDSYTIYVRGTLMATRSVETGPPEFLGSFDRNIHLSRSTLFWLGIKLAFAAVFSTETNY